MVVVLHCTSFVVSCLCSKSGCVTQRIQKIRPPPYTHTPAENLELSNVSTFKTRVGRSNYTFHWGHGYFPLISVYGSFIFVSFLRPLQTESDVLCEQWIRFWFVIWSLATGFVAFHTEPALNVSKQAIILSARRMLQSLKNTQLSAHICRRR